MPQLSFHPGLSGLGMLVAGGVAVILVALFYRGAYSALRPGPWSSLLCLRSAAIVIVLLLLFRPVFRCERETGDRRLLVFLIDTSASMRIADAAGGGSRLARATSRIQEWADRLRDQFEIRLIAFADSTNRVKRLDELTDLKAIGKATSLSRALGAARRTAPARDIEAVLLVSDGVHNSAGNPHEVAKRLRFPVHTIGTGSSRHDRRSFRDVWVTDLECPDRLSVDSRARLKGYVDATGFPGRVVRVVLRDGDRQVDERELVLDDVDGPQEITFELTPTIKGAHTYTMEVPKLPDERITENNRRSAGTQVVDVRIRVLYLEGTLRAEYGALVGRFLARDPALDFCALVQTRPNVFMQRSNIEGLTLAGIPDDPKLLAKFDVFLIGDLDHGYLGTAAQERICQRVRGGAGLLMMGGYHSLGPGGYGGTPLEGVLPVLVGDRQIGQITEPFLPELTPDGRQHPIFANIMQFFPSTKEPAVVEGLPPLMGCVRVLGAKPGGTVLAVHPRVTTRGHPMPVMVVQPVDEGRAAAFTGDTTRGWHQTLRTMNRESPFLRFWGQLVRWLAGRSEEVGAEAGIVVATDKSYYEPESKIEISAVVRGPEGEAAEHAKVAAVVQGVRQAPVSLVLQPVTGPAGHYSAVWVPQRSGQYEISVAAEFNNTRLEAEVLTVDVGRPYLEFDRLNLDDKTLIAIANATGGRYAHITTADRLVERIERRQEERRVQVELPLASPPFLWVLFVGVLTSEWLLRRRYQLR